ncbi:MAG: cobalamin biosynthesis protein [Bauldia sp.]|uniref:adenosylcobinamide-phosphate synthase CbiB n=1 Tax=Bauldia sp. TaxID=2575872 RepID=UPI001D3C77E7|nr:adenosylcobinamide-phosphate synthase CbiB [Bauldia sp.]MCB1495726.1 cobalamin biosynthesis protein [Bauldia sp.]
MIGLDHVWMLPVALVLDAVVGDPDFIWRRAPHPVALFGRQIDWFDRHLNSSRRKPWLRRIAGGATLFLVVAVAAAIGFGIEYGLSYIAFGWVGTVLVAAILLAGRSLYDHVAAVAKACDAGSLDEARKSVARIVGRDAAALDEAGVCRATIESMAENFADGVVAPAVWFLLLGLPGLAAYKAINTADSMIGHRTPRHEDFGWAAARLDDLVNLPASRLAGGLMALASPVVGGSIGHAFKVMRSEAPKHRSPNAGWPEAATAAALGLALAGPRRYRGVLGHDPYINASGRRQATPADIRRGLRLYLGSWATLAVVVAAAGGLVVELG